MPDPVNPKSHVHADVFITHSWRYHDDWNRMNDLLANQPLLTWRNFSVPWYDPAMDPNLPVGRQFVDSWLEGQVKPSQVVIFLASVYAVKSARVWLDKQREMANQFGKPIIAVPPFGEVGVPGRVAAFSNFVVDWEPDTLHWAISAALDVGRHLECRVELSNGV